AHVLTLASFVPEEQDAKLAAIGDAALLLDPVLHPTVKPPPSDAETVQALARTARALGEAQQRAPPALASTLTRLREALAQLGEATAADRARANDALMSGFGILLDQLRLAMDPVPVTLQTLPA